jgi:hypothetical protein
MANIDQQTYSALRHGGASQARACAEMGVSFGRVSALEAQFLVRARRRFGGEAALPAFARHDRHVAAVLAAGGYPALRR